MAKNYIPKTFLLVLFLSLFYGTSLFAQGELVPFSRRYPAPGEPTIIRGDMKMVGNSILGVQDELGGVNYTANQNYNSTNQTNNGVTRAYIDIDSDPAFNSLFNGALNNTERNYSGSLNSFGSPIVSSASDTGTFSSSATELDLNVDSGPNGETCATVKKAFLYWGGIYTRESFEQNNNIDRPDCNNCEFYTDIKILPPNATNYIDIKFANTGGTFDPDNPNSSLKSEVIFDGLPGRTYSFSPTESYKNQIYACVADVTSLFENLQTNADDIEGLWTVGNVRASTGSRGSGSGGGWSLVVVYEDPLAPAQKLISLFDGYAGIETQQGVPLADREYTEFNISGFETVPFGPVRVDIATIALEGDSGDLTGDEFQIFNESISDYVGMSYNDLPDVNNFYDSSIYSLGPVTRYPNSFNNLGFDSDHFRMDNPGEEYITNSDTEADFRLFTDGDSYSTFFNGFSIEVIAPDLEVIKKAFDDNGDELTEENLVDLGDNINYEITITNIGNDDAVDIRFIDLIPINTTFDVNQITLNGRIVTVGDDDLVINPNATAIDELTRLEFTTSEVSFDIGDELLEIGETAVVRFSVSVVDDCNLLQDVCTNRIQNLADVTYSGDINGRSFEQQSAFQRAVCQPEIEGPTVTLTDQLTCEGGPFQTVALCAEQTPLEINARGFIRYEWFFENTRLTQNSDGTPINDLDLSILVDQPGSYSVDAIKDPDSEFTDCLDRTFNFSVELFDPNDPPVNPFIEFGRALDPVCADDGTEIYEIQYCTEPIFIDPQIPDSSSYSWQRHNGSCTIASQNCVYAPNCYQEVSNAENFTVDDTTEGEYKLTVTITGGCVFDYYFNVTPIEIEPELIPTGNGCDDEVTFSITGVSFTSDQAINYRASFDVDNTITEMALGENSITLPRVDGRTYNVQGIVTVVDSAGQPIEDACQFLTNTERFGFSVFEGFVSEIFQAQCSVDDDTSDSFDPTVAEIVVGATDSYPTYIFELWRTNPTPAQRVSASGVVDQFFFRFGNINPRNTYEVRVFGNGNSNAGNCSAVVPITDLDIPLDFTASANVIEPLSCEPAEIGVSLTINDLGTQDPDPSFSYTIVEIPGNVYSGDDIIYIDDISNDPGPIDEDNPDPDADDRVINYFDINTAPTTTLTIRISSPDGCDILRPFELRPYDGPQITDVNVENLDCQGDTDGVIQVAAETESGIDLNDATFNLYIGDVLQVSQDANPVFTNLAEAVYTIEVVDDLGCPARIDQAITAPEALVAPEISAPPFYCEDDNFTSITIVTDATDGTTPYTYDLYRKLTATEAYPNSSFRTSDPNATPPIAINLSNIPEGFYQLVITDANDCNVTSNEIQVQPLGLTLAANDPVTQCTTTSAVPVAQVTVTPTFTVAGADTIATYSIQNTTDTTGTISTSTTNANGDFELPAGTHIIRATTNNFACFEDIEIVVDPIEQVSVAGADSFVCANDGTTDLTFTLTNSSGDYAYELVPSSGTTISVANETANPLVINNLGIGDYTLNISDNVTNCTATANATIFDREIELNAVAPIELACFDDEALLTITTTTGDVTDFEYSFDGGTTYQASNTIVVDAGTGLSRTYNYTARNLDTECTDTGAVVVTQPAEIILVNNRPTDITCNADGSGETLGSFEFTISGGTPSYTYTLLDRNDLSVVQTLPPTSNTTDVVFTNLNPGEYRFIVEDGNGCSDPQGLLDFDIFPEQEVGLANPFSNATCDDQVTLFFEIEPGTGTSGPGSGNRFTISRTLDGVLPVATDITSVDFIDPSASNTDGISQIGDPEFPITTFNTEFPSTYNAQNIIDGKVFAISNLDFDVQGDFIVVFDGETRCRYILEYDTDPSPSFQITATPVPAGACNLGSGILNFEVNNITGAPATVDIEVFPIGDETNIVGSANNVVLNNGLNNSLPSIARLPAGNLRIRVQDQANECNATADFIIEVADPINDPLFSAVRDICEDEVSLTILGSGGTPPYAYAVGTGFGDTAEPASFNTDNNIVVDDITALFTNAGRIQIPIWVQDLNGCTASVVTDLEGFDTLDFAPVDTDIVPVNDCIDGGGSRIEITPSTAWAGEPPYFYKIDQLNDFYIEITDITAPLIIPAPEGDYTVTLTDSYGCLEPPFPITIEPNLPLDLEINNVLDLACTNNGETFDINIANGEPGASYTFELNSAPATVTEATRVQPADDFTESFGPYTIPGLYEFKVFNTQTQCEYFITQNIEEIEQIALIASDDRLTCNADGSGEVIFEILNYEGAIDYSVDGALLGNVASGTISDYGDPAATLTPTTGTGSIDGTTGIATLTGFQADTYTITLTAGTRGEAECTASTDILITEPDAIVVNAELVAIPPDCGNGTGVIRATATGGTGDYTYELLRNGTSVVTNNTTGVFDSEVTIDGSASLPTIYTVRVIDETGICDGLSSDVPIAPPVPPTLFDIAPVEPNCVGESVTLTALLTPNVPTSTDLRYALFVFDATQEGDKGAQVAAPQILPVFPNVYEGSYIIEVTDNLGCSDVTNEIQVNDPQTLEFDDPILVNAVSCDPTSETFELVASGGTPGASPSEYLYERFSAPISEGGVVMEDVEGLTATFDNLNGTVYFRVTDDRDCEDFISFEAAPVPDPVTFELDFTDTPLCFGEAGAIVDLAENTAASGGVGNYTYNLYLAADAARANPLSETSTPPVTRLSNTAFGDLIAGDYTYVVTSDGSSAAVCSTPDDFTINQHPEVTLEDPIIVGIGCPGENDAEVRLKVVDNGNGVGPFVYALGLVGEEPVFITEEDAITEAVFEFLAPGDYFYYVIDNGTQCPGPTGEFTIVPKEPLLVTYEEALSEPALCKGDVDGIQVYTITGGTPPYYAILSDDLEALAPDPIEIITSPITSTFIVPGSNDAGFDPVVGVRYDVENLVADTDYIIYFFDSGNGRTGDDLRICDPDERQFIFETEDLDQFTALGVPDCELLNYTITANNTNPEVSDDILLMRVFQLLDDGSQGTEFPATGLVAENIPPGSYEVYLESTETGCTTIVEEYKQLILEAFERIAFVDADADGNEIQPFIPTNEINKYQLQVTGGVNPGGINPYTFEIFYSTSPFTSDQQTTAEMVDVDAEGFFEIEKDGYYIFKVIDNYGDNGVTCFDITDSIGLNFIAIDVPNVFNPSSRDSSMSTWYPENLTTLFSDGSQPTQDGEAEIPAVITNSGGEIEGGTTTGGTTTNGITVGGTASGGGSSSTVSLIPSATPGVTSETIVTTGGTMNEDGSYTGGTSIITQYLDNGETQVTIIDGGQLTGGTVATNGVVTGGTVTGGIPVTAVTQTIGGNTVYVITTSGSTTGGTTSGGTTTGGTTTYSGTSTTAGGTNSSGSYITTGGTTEGAITNGGTTTGGITTTITIPAGGGVPGVDYTANTLVTGGTTTSGTTTGGTTTGGVLTGGTNAQETLEFLDYENMEVFVFDRYGRMLKQFKGIVEKDKGEEGWDGTYQNKNMPSGDYWYLIKLNDPEGREFTGHFTLYRR